jgi:hypothetical protein
LDPQFAIVETSPSKQFSRLVKESLNNAIIGNGKLTENDVLALDGMSGSKYRIFINNLIGSMSDARYLEIGVWQGSTLCAAIYKNKVRALAIDDWSGHGGPADKFFANLGRFKGEASVSFLDSDFRAVQFNAVGKFNVYFYDGPHDEAAHFDSLNLAQAALDDQFILIVDDWNRPRVRSGTTRALAVCGLQLDFVAEIRTTLDNTDPKLTGRRSDWHNGYFVASCAKGPK